MDERHAEGLGLALHAFAWSDEAATKGLARDAVYLVRPDGYVGLADGEADPATLQAYVARWSRQDAERQPHAASMTAKFAEGSQPPH